MSKRRQIILSCEHAGNKVPAEYKSIFAEDEDVLSTHRGYDIGISPVVSAMQKLLGCPLCIYDKTRLLIEVNRTQKRALFSEFSGALTESEKQHLVEAYYMPYQDQLYKVISEQTAGVQVLHLSLHSFTPVLNGKVRNADIGILYDPSRQQELRLARYLQKCIKLQTGFRIRRNYPYLGRSDGTTSWFRAQFSQSRYLGIEIECNQALLADYNPVDLARKFVEAILKID